MRFKNKWEYALAGFVLAAAVLAVIVLSLNYGSSGGRSKPADRSETKDAMQTQAPTNSETKTEPADNAQGTDKSEPKFDWANAEVTEENVKKALEDNIGAAMAIPLTEERFRKFVTSADAQGEYVEITLNPGIFADYKDFVKRAGGSLIAYSKVLFENPQVYEVSLNVLIDNVGGGENNGVYISWRRDQVADVDYDAVLDNMFGDYTIPYQLARKYNIQKDIYDGLEEFNLPESNNL
ncbi:hypothetical protein [Paenibacillus vini]|uniref:Uncharacterized protein n=1 Tax=Paenibacillus vini TaxID=1476024 RepID=A0ABQ4MAT5_9BACL|nr:hypothetical protein [Paenibacillus vini]GIP53102.1 hypothetical protein J42TS3_21370 [Paenibacillus vini]